MQDEEDYSEIETTEAEFDAMWAESTPVPTVVRYVAQPQTEPATIGTKLTGSWAAGGSAEKSDETESAYARLSG